MKWSIRYLGEVLEHKHDLLDDVPLLLVDLDGVLLLPVGLGEDHVEGVLDDEGALQHEVGGVPPRRHILRQQQTGVGVVRILREFQV